MRISLQPAFVLHHRPYRETSLIVDLFTQEQGRIAVVARGVRTTRKSTRALLQPFVPLLVSFQGNGELMTLCSVEAQEGVIQLQGDCLLSALYLNELLMRVLHKYDPHPRLYTIYHDTLLKLQQKSLEQKILRIFEKKLLEELGYGLQLQYDIDNGKPIDAELDYTFEVEQGFRLYHEERVAPRCGIIQVIFPGKSILALAAETLWDSESLRDAKRLMRLAFAPLLGQKPLQSRKLFVEVEVE